MTRLVGGRSCAPARRPARRTWAASCPPPASAPIVLGVAAVDAPGAGSSPRTPRSSRSASRSTLFVIAVGGALLWGFVRWQRHREATGADPLVHLDLVKIPPLRSGLIGLFTQNLILMGVFFTVPLYLQLVLGLDALETGIKMLPVSITMFVASAIGSRLSTRFPVRTIVRAGLWITIVGVVALLATVKPDLAERRLRDRRWPLLGVGMGLIVSQLGNVVQSSVDASGPGRGRRPAVHRSAARLLARRRPDRRDRADRPDRRVRVEDRGRRTHQHRGRGPGQRRRRSRASTSSPPTRSRPPPRTAGLDDATTAAIVDDYEQAQLQALKAGLLAAALLALVSLAFTRDLPHGEPSLEAVPADDTGDA